MANPKVTLREELIFILTQATELEHSLTCSYLFTALSLKDRLEDGLNEEMLAAVRGWRGMLTGVAIDEMMHLAIVNSLLVAVGGAPNFDRPNFPHECEYFMPDLEIGLQPFSDKTMQHFIAVEQPFGGNIVSPYAPSIVRHVEGDLENEIGADPYILQSQGDLYGLVADGMRTLAGRLGEENLFIGPAPRQAFIGFMESCGWEPVTDLESALNAVARIVEQGEGASSENQDSHFWKFTRIRDEYLALKEKYPDFEPSHPVLENPFGRTPPEQQGEVNLIDDEFAIQISDLFNEAYTSFLLVLGRFFALTDESEEEAAQLAEASFWLMKSGDPAARRHARTPAGRRGVPRSHGRPQLCRPDYARAAVQERRLASAQGALRGARGLHGPSRGPAPRIVPAGRPRRARQHRRHAHAEGVGRVRTRRRRSRSIAM